MQIELVDSWFRFRHTTRHEECMDVNASYHNERFVAVTSVRRIQVDGSQEVTYVYAKVQVQIDVKYVEWTV